MVPKPHAIAQSSFVSIGALTLGMKVRLNMLSNALPDTELRPNTLLFLIQGLTMLPWLS